MAIISYQITSMTQDGSTTVVNLRYYIGAVTTENQEDPNQLDGRDINTVAVTRYRRTATVATETITRSGTLSHDDLVPHMNAALATKATELGHTPLEGQTNE